MYQIVRTMCYLANILIDCWLLYLFYIYVYLCLYIVVFYIVCCYNLSMINQTENHIHNQVSLSPSDETRLFELGIVNKQSQIKNNFSTKCLKCGKFAHFTDAKVQRFIEPKKSKNQVRRERHIFKRLQAKNLRAITHNSKLVNQIIDGENVAPNHMKTNSVASIKQNERSRFRVINYDRQISKGKGCTCDGMNFMCKSHRRKFKMT